MRPKTNGVWLFMRGGLENGSPKAAADNFRRNTRIYPLSQASDPPETVFISGSGKAYNTISPNDFNFYVDLDRLVQEEPIESLDPETRGLLASIGIVKGKPFNPDGRMKRILADAAAIGNATARAIVFQPRQPGARLCPDVKKNRDGSVDLYFGPNPPRGKKKNWVETVPGKSWFVILRLYGPQQPWIDRTWRPGEIERLDW